VSRFFPPHPPPPHPLFPRCSLQRVQETFFLRAINNSLPFPFFPLCSFEEDTRFPPSLASFRVLFPATSRRLFPLSPFSLSLTTKFLPVSLLFFRSPSPASETGPARGAGLPLFSSPFFRKTVPPFLPRICQILRAPQRTFSFFVDR